MPRSLDLTALHVASMSLALACVSCSDPPPDVSDAGPGAVDASTMDAGEPSDAGGGDAGSGLDAGADGGAGTDAGEPADPCADRPPLELPIAFDVIYGNSSRTETRFEGITPWMDAFGMAFPLESGVAKRIRTRRGEYAVIAFDTFDVAQTRGLLDTDNPQLLPNTGNKLVSISRCPGDFRPSEDPDCVRNLGPVSNLRWGFEDAGFSCRLERDQRYYVNILFTGDDGLPATWDCTGAPADAEDCAMRIGSTSE